MNSVEIDEKIKNLLNAALELVQPCSREAAEETMRFKVQLSTGVSLAVLDIYSYNSLLEDIYNSDKRVSQNFSRESVCKFFDEQIFSKKFLEKVFSNEDAGFLMHKFIGALSENVRVIAPISGIRLDKKEKLIIGPFEIGYSKELKSPLANDDEYYICSEIKDSFDNEKSISIAQDEFDDFIRLIYFIAGRKDNSIYIKTGLPSYPSFMLNQIYINTISYQIQKNSAIISDVSISNKVVNKVPVDNDFFKNSRDFSRLWDFYKNRKNGNKIPDFHSRILNCAISIGQAMKSQNEKESLIHTCISLEILLSYDEGSLFQKSIADRLADTFVFIVAKEKESRIKINSLLKKVYRMRSALVHGGNKDIDQSYVDIIQLTRAAIAELLTSEKYKEVKKIDALYEMVRDAQNSY